MRIPTVPSRGLLRGFSGSHGVAAMQKAIYIKHLLCISKVYKAGVRFLTNLKFSGRNAGCAPPAIGLPVHKEKERSLLLLHTDKPIL